MSHAQNLEDVRLWRVLYDCPDKFFVDIGANHPTTYSVTQWFSDRGWVGINVEPGPEFEDLARARTDDTNLNLAIGSEEGWCDLVVPSVASGRAKTVPIETAPTSVHPEALGEVTTSRVRQRRLADVLADHAGGRGIAFLSVDVEGNEAEVLASNDWSRFRPRVVVVEAIDPVTLLPAHRAWEPTLHENGYRYAVADGLNRFYLAEEHAELLERFDLDFAGRFMDANPNPNAFHELTVEHQECLGQNALLVAQLDATRASRAFRIGSLALAPARALRPIVAPLARRRRIDQ